jgi:hypothetical protein
MAQMTCRNRKAESSQLVEEFVKQKGDAFVVKQAQLMLRAKRKTCRNETMVVVSSKDMQSIFGRWTEEPEAEYPRGNTWHTTPKLASPTRRHHSLALRVGAPALESVIRSAPTLMSKQFQFKLVLLGQSRFVYLYHYAF